MIAMEMKLAYSVWLTTLSSHLTQPTPTTSNTLHGLLKATHHYQRTNNMEFQPMFNFIGGAILVAVGWWCKEIWDSVKALKEDIKKIEIDLPKNYVSKADIESRLDKIDATLERIFDKLENKADK